MIQYRVLLHNFKSNTNNILTFSDYEDETSRSSNIVGRSPNSIEASTSTLQHTSSEEAAMDIENYIDLPSPDLGFCSSQDINNEYIYDLDAILAKDPEYHDPNYNNILQEISQNVNT